MPAHQADQRQFERILRRNVTVPLGTGVLSAILFVVLVVYLLGNLRAVEDVQRAVSQTSELGRLTAESENGMRGYVLTGDRRFLDTFDVAMPRFGAELEALRNLLEDEASRQRLQRVQTLHAQWQKFAQEMLALRRADNTPAATQRLAAGEGKRLTDAIRAEFDGIMQAERQLLQERNARAATTSVVLTVLYVVVLLGLKGLLAFFGRRDLLALSDRYGAALRQQGEHTAYLQAQAWLRDGQNQLGQVLAGRNDLQAVGRKSLDFLAGYLGSSVGAVYVVDEDGRSRRIASYGLATDQAAQKEQLAPGENLVAEVAASGRPMRLEPVPAQFLRISTAIADGPPAAVLITPSVHEGRVNGVIEVGLMRPLTDRDPELMERLANLVGGSIEAARFRQRQQDLLEQTQALNEELQTQQEELRVANEELEEQSRALKESQANLESQQAELEQTNVQLSSFAERVEEQRDALQQAQAQLEQRAAELERASRYKSEFLANMSHELRTPLNSSLILAKLLADNAQGNLNPEQVKFAQSIQAAGNDLLALINDILDIAKVEAGKLEVRPEATPLAPLAEGLRAMFEPLAAGKGLRLEVLVAADAPVSIETDPQRLEQILKNLLSNAIKFTDRGSVALHVARQAPSSLAFEVRDSGIGIAPAQQEAIFEAFRQADGTTSRRHGGTGLGLSISRDLARLLSGEISVSSRPGQGSTFRLVLPLQFAPGAQRPAADATPAPQQSPAPTPLPRPERPGPVSHHPAPPPFPDQRAEDPVGRRTVLVVEDDVAFAQILFDLARERGYRCLVAHQAGEGCELASRFTPDAVLLDMRLPGDSGLTVLQRLKDDPRTRHIPVHVVSVEDLAETALQMGAIGYARKPASLEELRHVFEHLEEKLSQKVKRVLLVEDDRRLQESVAELIGDDDVQITAVSEGAQALDALRGGVFDCMITDLALPDMTGQELLRRMASGESRSFPPVIVYTGRNLTREEEAELLRYSRSIIIKGARSPERLLDEVTLFLHQVEGKLSSERQRMLRTARTRDKAFEGRRILVVDDDVRNIFALTSALEQKGAEVIVARNGQEALDRLGGDEDVDLVLMDLMMPVMDGFTAMREIRRQPRRQRLPIIAVTAKAMKEDQQKCLAAGANDYLAKPIELERLFSLMRVWMPKLERI
ncbi:response regulator [Ramlibacter sp. RBP-2]|uniref:Virulence sensor protein BvgS n=1 Tax=Ramlibacter lithotrophicus TaxID=2606681 RepID=A0A7X6I5R6_9BURK|nr:response regulator [Ramlibacter lithotrophicus]NKE65470.1 response regulator [Ramlibacter lithotrophicus]